MGSILPPLGNFPEGKIVFDRAPRCSFCSTQAGGLSGFGVTFMMVSEFPYAAVSCRLAENKSTFRFPSLGSGP